MATLTKNFFHPYTRDYHCGMGGHYVSQEDVILNKASQPICPVHKKRLREKPRHKTEAYTKRQKIKQAQIRRGCS